jgi:hypothetical protein
MFRVYRLQATDTSFAPLVDDPAAAAEAVLAEIGAMVGHQVDEAEADRMWDGSNQALDDRLQAWRVATGRST